MIESFTNHECSCSNHSNIMTLHDMFFFSWKWYQYQFLFLLSQTRTNSDMNVCKCIDQVDFTNIFLIIPMSSCTTRISFYKKMELPMFMIFHDIIITLVFMIFIFIDTWNSLAYKHEHSYMHYMILISIFNQSSWFFPEQNRLILAGARGSLAKA